MAERLKTSTILIRDKVKERLRANKRLTNVEAEVETARACGVSVPRVKRARTGRDN